MKADGFERVSSEAFMLTVKEAGKLASLSPALIYQLCREQRLVHYRFGTEGKRGKILIDPKDLEQFMRQCRVERHPLLDDLE